MTLFYASDIIIVLMRDEVIGFVIIAAILGLTFLVARPASTIAGLIQIPDTGTNFHAIRHEGDGDATVTLTTPDGRSGSLLLLGGELYLKPAKPGDPPVPANQLVLQPLDEKGAPLTGDALTTWSDEHGFKGLPVPALTVKVTHDAYFIDSNPGHVRGEDFGTFAAYRPGARHTRDDSFEVGLRYSPVRLLYGTLAPDLLVTKDAGGVGVSFYPPPKHVGYFWRHIGLEFGYVASFTGRSAPGYLAGVSFSTLP